MNALESIWEIQAQRHYKGCWITTATMVSRICLMSYTQETLTLRKIMCIMTASGGRYRFALHEDA